MYELYWIHYGELRYRGKFSLESDMSDEIDRMIEDYSDTDYRPIILFLDEQKALHQYEYPPVEY